MSTGVIIKIARITLFIIRFIKNMFRPKWTLVFPPGKLSRKIYRDLPAISIFRIPENFCRDPGKFKGALKPIFFYSKKSTEIVLQGNDIPK